jgi:hypothetical protein
MAYIRLVALVAVLIFLSLPPTLPSKPIGTQAVGQNLPGISKIISKFVERFKKGMRVYDLFLGLYDPKDKAPNTEAESSGFYITFSVGNPTMSITAQMSISSEITVLENYEPSSSSTYECCNANLSCSKTNCNG